MSRMLLFSDLHLRPDTRDACGAVLDGIRDALVASPHDVLLFLGDWWHVRYSLPIELFNWATEHVRSLSACVPELWIVPGNHDQIDVLGRNALEVWADIPNVRVFNEPTATEWGLVLPYRAPEVLAHELAQYAGTPRTVFMHGAIRGAHMNDATQNADGLELDKVDAGLCVLAGHYHKRQRLREGAWYIGSPWQTRADEAGQPKGYAVWDGTAVTFVDTQWGPKHQRFAVENLDALGTALAATPIGARDKLHVRVKSAADLEPVARALRAQYPQADIVVTPDEVRTSEARLGLGPTATWVDYAKAYIGREGDGLDPDRLLSVFKEHVDV